MNPLCFSKGAGVLAAVLNRASRFLPVFTGCSFLVSSTLAGNPLILSVNPEAAGVPSSPMLYGAFFEDINRAGDGGLYAEMIQNRSFEDDETPLAWSFVSGPEAKGAMVLDKRLALNPNNPTSLRLEIQKADATQRVGIANDGFRGCVKPMFVDRHQWLADWDQAVKKATRALSVSEGKAYRFSCYIRSNDIKVVTASLESRNGKILASAPIELSGTSWAKYERVLCPSAKDPDARLILSANTPGTLWLDMVSLFPKETFMGRACAVTLRKCFRICIPASFVSPVAAPLRGKPSRMQCAGKKPLGT